MLTMNSRRSPSLSVSPISAWASLISTSTASASASLKPSARKIACGLRLPDHGTWVSACFDFVRLMSVGNHFTCIAMALVDRTEPAKHKPHECTKHEGRHVCSFFAASCYSSLHGRTHLVVPNCPARLARARNARHLRPGGGEARLCPQRLPRFRLARRPLPQVARALRGPDAAVFGAGQSRARDDLGRRLHAKPVPLLPHSTRFRPARAAP